MVRGIKTIEMRWRRRRNENDKSEEEDEVGNIRNVMV